MPIKYSILSKDSVFRNDLLSQLDDLEDLHKLYDGEDISLMLKSPFINENHLLFLHSSSLKKFNPDFIKKLTSKNPITKVIVYGNVGDTSCMRLAYQSGAVAILTENKDQFPIGSIIRVVLNGGTVLCPFITKDILNPYINAGFNNGLEEISGKTKRIWMLLFDGKSYIEMAEITGLSIDGVREQIKKLYRKLGVNSRGQATAAYMKLHASFPIDTDS